MRWLTFGVLLLGGLAHAQDAGVPAPAEVAAPPDAGVSADDEALLKEIAAATAGPAPGAAPAPAPATSAAPAPARGSSSSMFSNLYNPALSLNGLLLGTATTGAAGGNQASVSVQEIELQIISNVDPYFSASAILSIPGLSGLEVEEGYITLLPQPFGISLRGGKVRVPFGRENAMHTHALPFVDRALINSDVFGPEGLSEVGLEATWLAPLPWYSLLTVSGMDGQNEALFNSPLGRDLAGFASLRNVFDVTDDSTIEAGLSYAVGNNQDRKLAQALGAHLVYKWRPARDVDRLLGDGDARGHPRPTPERPQPARRAAPRHRRLLRHPPVAAGQALVRGRALRITRPQRRPA